LAAFVRGDVVVVPFPFSGEERYKRRPAIVVASWPFEASNDYLLCVISAQPANDPYILEISNSDLQRRTTVGFRKKSYIRPTYLFAADESLIAYKMGRLKADKIHAVMKAIRSVLNNETEMAPASVKEPEDDKL
jgi:mRNA interferase MazF